MLIKRLPKVLLGRIRFIAWTYSAVLVAALGIAFVVPQRYTSSVQLLVEPPQQDPIAGIALPGGLLSTHIATQMNLLQSSLVLTRTARALDLLTKQEWTRKWEQTTGGVGDKESWIAEQLLRRMEVTPARDSSIITVAYSAEDPRFAARFLGALVQAYIATKLEIQVQPARNYSRFFESQGRALRDRFETAQQKLTDFQQAHSITASDERLDIESARLSDLVAQVSTLEAAAVAAQSRQRQGQNRALLDEVRLDPTVAGLSADLSRDEARLTDLMSRLGDNHPQVVTQRAAVEDTRKRLREAQGRAAGGLDATNAVVQSRLAESRRLLNEQKDRAVRMRSLRDQSNVLQRDVKQAQDAFDAVATRVNLTTLQAADEQPSVTVLRPPTVAAKASSPNGLLFIAAGVLGGLVTALLTALFVEARRPLLRTPEDVSDIINRRLIGSIPRAYLQGPGPRLNAPSRDSLQLS